MLDMINSITLEEVLQRLDNLEEQVRTLTAVIDLLKRPPGHVTDPGYWS